MNNHHRATLCQRIAAIPALILMVGTAQAAPFKIFSPIVHEGESAVEYRGYRDFDSRNEINRSQTHKIALEHGVTSYWLTELEGEFEKEGGGPLKGTAVEWENVFQLTPQGKYWADVGLFAEYEFAAHSGNADKIKLGPLIEKEFSPRLSATLNAFFEHEVGSNAQAGTTFSYGARVKYSINRYLQPALEIFGEPGNLKGSLPAFQQQEHWVGPALHGSTKLEHGHTLNYRAAALFGVTDAASHNRLVVSLEYEF